MTPHQLGQTLRAQVLLQRRRTGRVQGPRLEAVIRDLCAEDHQDFCAPLCFLVSSPAFAAATDRDPALAGPTPLNAWNRELEQIYAGGLCQRLQPVLAGLLDLPATAASANPIAPRSSAAQAAAHQPPLESEAWPPPATAAKPPVPRRPQGPPRVSAEAASTRRPSGRVRGRFSGARTVLVTLLAFLGGVLLPVALALALGIGIGHRPAATPSASVPPGGNPDAVPHTQTSSAIPTPAPLPELTAPPASASGQDRQEPARAAATTPAGEDPALLQQRAIRSVQQLYDALAARDYERARGYVSPQAADQFDPNDLEQYEQVAIQDLHVTGQTGTSIQLEGVVNLLQPDGSRHLETRSFSVEAASEPARVTASAFGRVLR